MSEESVDQMVREASKKFGAYDIEVQDISIPIHRDGMHIWNAIAIEGANSLMIKGNSMGTNWKGYYNTSLLDSFARGRLTRPNDLSETTKLVMLVGQYMSDRYHGRFYAHAQNLSRQLCSAYDEYLKEFDVLLMPTVPMKATEIPKPECSREEYISRALEMINNTSPFNVTGHPAISIPCGVSDGLPVGMMLIGKHFDDRTVLKVARAFETLS